MLAAETREVKAAKEAGHQQEEGDKDAREEGDEEEQLTAHDPATRCVLKYWKIYTGTYVCS